MWYLGDFKCTGFGRPKGYAGTMGESNIVGPQFRQIDPAACQGSGHQFDVRTSYVTVRMGVVTQIVNVDVDSVS